MIAIFIACLGLISLTAFSTEQRTKEVGVRKVLGASTVDIALLLSRDLIIPVVFGNLLAFPVAYCIVRPWLEGFPNRIAMSVSPFLGGALLSFAIAAVTVTFHTIKTARAKSGSSVAVRISERIHGPDGVHKEKTVSRENSRSFPFGVRNRELPSVDEVLRGPFESHVYRLKTRVSVAGLMRLVARAEPVEAARFCIPKGRRKMRRSDRNVRPTLTPAFPYARHTISHRGVD